MTFKPLIAASFGLLSSAAFAQSAHQHGVAELFFAAAGEELEIEILSPADNFLGFEHAPANEQQHQILDDAKKQAAQAMQLFVFNGGQCELEKVGQHWGDLDQEDEHHDEHAHDKYDEHKDHDDHTHDKHDEHKDHDDHAHDKHDEHKDHDDHAHEKHDEHKDHDDHAHDKHDEHKDHDDHAHESHDEHKNHDDHDHEAHGEHAGHSDVRLTYHFHCHELAELSSFDLQLFNYFPRMQKIQVQGASDRGQVAIEATPTQNKVKL
ncbi:DUF2796 domain-containing protein [Agarivorans sp. 1_MG-2023]|uniref:ZrgA family zinc uptake protein n=1 Tax=Agarivorans sp. 1_MG-2023 TaxID=3062634 RepID=UPI0026E2F6B4|nr:DUF2796 domain-containing protein [Agarivorans sp. 1_MG-2023]MDO6764365.1 DUF2796 domain-containing protein [Agarivorans sp. 1_MG-2023]